MRKSRELMSPATGRRWKSVRADRNDETVDSCGMDDREYPQFSIMSFIDFCSLRGRCVINVQLSKTTATEMRPELVVFSAHLVLLARILVPKPFHGVPDETPRLDLVVCVLRPRQRHPVPVLHRKPGEFRPPPSVLLVSESRMVRLEVRPRVESPVRDEVQFGYVAGKPVYLRRVQDQEPVGRGAEVIQEGRDVGVRHAAAEVDEEVEPGRRDRSGLDSSYVHVVLPAVFGYSVSGESSLPRERKLTSISERRGEPRPCP